MAPLFDTAQRRARLARRHHLAVEARLDDPGVVTEDLIAVHSTDPSSVYQGLWARMGTGDAGTISAALYEQRSLIRLLAMRRTVFVTTRDLVPVLQAACGDAVAAKERRKLLQWLAADGIAEDAETWLREVEEAALAALAARGESTAAELARDDPRLRLSVTVGRGTRFEARQPLSSRVVALLAASGRVVRGRPNGTWASSQYRWSTMASWCPEGSAVLAAQDAEAQLARRWLRSYGPASADDLRWWAGWTVRQTRRALTAVAPVEVDLDGVAGGTGLVLADDLAPEPAAEPWGALLPPLDSTPMGWQAREWFLGGHAPKLFDRAGNVGPTLWWDGRVVGGWAQRKDGEVVIRPLEDIGADATAVLRTLAAEVQVRLGAVRVNARTRGVTDAEREALTPET